MNRLNKPAPTLSDDELAALAQYDGSAPLKSALAKICGYSPTNHNKLAELVADAVKLLGIEKQKNVNYAPIERLQIYQWHYKRLYGDLPDVAISSPVQDVEHGVALSDSNIDTMTVQDLKHIDSNPESGGFGCVVQDFEQSKIDQAQPETAKPLPDIPVQNLKHDGTVQKVKRANVVQNFKQVADYSDFEVIHFAINAPRGDGMRRTTVAIVAYIVKALSCKQGLLGYSDVRRWIDDSIRADGVRFDGFAPLTRQVERLIVEALV